METPVEWCTIHDVRVGDFIEVRTYTGEWVLFKVTAFGDKAILGNCIGCHEFAWEDSKKMRLSKKNKLSNEAKRENAL